MPLSTLTVVLGVIGAIFAPLTLRPAQFVSLLLVGAFVGAFVALLARSISENRTLDTREALVEAGRSAAVGAVSAVGAGVLVLAFGAYGWVAVGGAVLSYVLLRALRDSGRAPRPAAAPNTREERPVSVLTTAPLASCSTSELTAAWEASYDLLQAAASPLVKARIAALRGAYLDELERRDEDGVRRWLSAGVAPASDAEGWFGSHDEDDGQRRPGVG